MTSSVQNNNFQFIQTYSALTYAGGPFITVPLVNSTGANYQPGLLMAKYTAGGNAGYYGDYVAAGTNGQQTCIGVFADDNYPIGTNGTAASLGNPLALIQVFGLGTRFKANLITATTPGDIPTGMAAIGARLVTVFPVTTGSPGTWYWA